MYRIIRDNSLVIAGSPALRNQIASIFLLLFSSLCAFKAPNIAGFALPAFANG
jgi:hypothetical protein